MKQSKKIAICGGIGNGKSTVAEIIKSRGFSVFSCDEIYNNLLDSGYFNEIFLREFGDVFTDGNVDRTKLSAIVFSDRNKLRQLTKITNEKIIENAIELMQNLGGIVFCEVPLLFENGYEKYFDGVIVVLRNKEDRINSVMKRSNLSREQVISRINSQINYDILDFAKYYVIHNNSNLAYLEYKTDKILDKITQ